MASDSGFNTDEIILSLALDYQNWEDWQAVKKKTELQSLGISDLDLQALVDGELSEPEAERLEKIIPFYPALQARYEELKQQKTQLKLWWQTFKKQH